MSSRKRFSAPDQIYANHLYGRFQNNPAINRSSLIERMYQRILTELAANRFKWSGLPDSIDVRFLELNLFYFALSVFYKDEEFDKFLALKATGTNYLNMLDNPVAFRVVGNNFVGKKIDAKDCVPIWANYMRMPDLDIVTIYSSKFAELDRTIEINSDNARQTKYLVSGENQRLSVVNINRMQDEGVNGINIAGPMQDLEFVKAVDLGINPDSIEKLHILRTRLWNECMGLLGIENANQDKKERLVSDEVDANNDQTSSMRNVNLNARKAAAQQINDKYGLNVTVEYYTDAERAAMNDTETDTSEESDEE